MFSVFPVFLGKKKEEHLGKKCSIRTIIHESSVSPSGVIITRSRAACLPTRLARSQQDPILNFVGMRCARALPYRPHALNVCKSRVIRVWAGKHDLDRTDRIDHGYVCPEISEPRNEDLVWSDLYHAWSLWLVTVPVVDYVGLFFSNLLDHT